MQVYLGNYNIPNDNDASYDRQKTEILQVIQAYGDKNIAGITVGNEYILKWVTFYDLPYLWLISPSYILQNGGGPANGPAGDQGAALLIPNIDDTRTTIQGMNLNIPIGNADAGAYFNNKVLAAIDYGVRTIFPCSILGYQKR